jgi:hypothetical protein
MRRHIGDGHIELGDAQQHRRDRDDRDAMALGLLTISSPAFGGEPAGTGGEGHETVRRKRSGECPRRFQKSSWRPIAQTPPGVT